MEKRKIVSILEGLSDHTELSQILKDSKDKRDANPEIKRLIEAIYLGYTLDDNKTGYKKKTSFSPSELSYGSGVCPKRWYLQFKGGNHNSKSNTPLQIAGMKNGAASHERIQNAMKSVFENIQIEKEIFLVDPPVHGFVDAVVWFENVAYVVEIKTVKHVNFEYRKRTNKIADYHLVQILIYKYALGINKGMLLYESKDTNELFGIPVDMTDENKETVEAVLDWCRKVWKCYVDDLMPKRSFKKNSKICRSCPVETTCDEKDGELQVDWLHWTR